MEDKKNNLPLVYFHTPCSDHPELLERILVHERGDEQEEEIDRAPITFEEYMENKGLFCQQSFIRFMKTRFTEQYAKYKKEELEKELVKRYTARLFLETLYGGGQTNALTWRYFRTPCSESPELLERIIVYNLDDGLKEERDTASITFEEYMKNRNLFCQDSFVRFMKTRFTEQYAKHTQEKEVKDGV